MQVSTILPDLDIQPMDITKPCFLVVGRSEFSGFTTHSLEIFLATRLATDEWVLTHLAALDKDTQSNLVVNANTLTNDYIALPKGYKISLTQ